MRRPQSHRLLGSYIGSCTSVLGGLRLVVPQASHEQQSRGLLDGVCGRLPLARTASAHLWLYLRYSFGETTPQTRLVVMPSVISHPTPLVARFFALFARTLAYACILCAWILGNILVGQWGNVGRYLNRFGVLSKDFPPGSHFPPRYIEISLRDLP